VVVVGPDLSACIKTGQALLFGFRGVAKVDLAPPHVELVETRSHLENLVAYVLRQVSKHGLDVHPALWPGSCFPDLVGARLIPGMSLRLEELLPRFRISRAFELVGLDPDLPVLNDSAIRDTGVSRIVRAAAFVHAADPDLLGRSAPILATRMTATHMARAVGIRNVDIADALGISPRTLRRFVSSPANPLALRALRTRLSLENAVQYARWRAAG
jgi:hypothetical protein